MDVDADEFWPMDDDADVVRPTDVNNFTTDISSATSGNVNTIVVEADAFRLMDVDADEFWPMDDDADVVRPTDVNNFTTDISSATSGNVDTMVVEADAFWPMHVAADAFRPMDVDADVVRPMDLNIVDCMDLESFLPVIVPGKPIHDMSDYPTENMPVFSAFQFQSVYRLA
jgi:uncharacterized protein (DUF736 family)